VEEEVVVEAIWRVGEQTTGAASTSDNIRQIRRSRDRSRSLGRSFSISYVDPLVADRNPSRLVLSDLTVPDLLPLSPGKF
jgi:hypothetical protein